MQDQLVLLQEREQQIPGSVNYTINGTAAMRNGILRTPACWFIIIPRMNLKKITWNSGFVLVVMCIAAKKIQNATCASSVHPKPVWKEWIVWM